MEKYITDNCALYNGDCLEVMDMLIEKGVKVDAIITDPPFGTTSCAWDSVIPFDKMWERLNKLIKDNGAICLFGSEPFSSYLRMSNIRNYKYDWIWIKERGTGFARSKKQPMRKNENISVFYKKQPYYNYKGEKLDKPYKHALPISKSDSDKVASSNMDGDKRIYAYYEYATKNNILNFSRDSNKQHPTQKPVALIEYLIKTYTNEDELVLDFTMGSGTTCIAARNTNRKVIGIELDEKYFDIAVSRYKGEEIVKESKKEETKEKGLKLASWKKK